MNSNRLLSILVALAATLMFLPIASAAAPRGGVRPRSMSCDQTGDFVGDAIRVLPPGGAG